MPFLNFLHKVNFNAIHLEILANLQNTFIQNVGQLFHWIFAATKEYARDVLAGEGHANEIYLNMNVSTFLQNQKFQFQAFLRANEGPGIKRNGKWCHYFAAKKKISFLSIFLLSFQFYWSLVSHCILNFCPLLDSILHDLRRFQPK